MPWWFFSLLSNVCIMYVEYANGLGNHGSWLRTLPRTVAPIIIAQWCLYRTWSGAPNWLIAWAVFAIGNALMRVAGVAVTTPGQVGSWYLVVGGVATMIGGSLVLKLGLR